MRGREGGEGVKYISSKFNWGVMKEMDGLIVILLTVHTIQYNTIQYNTMQCNNTHHTHHTNTQHLNHSNTRERM